MQYKIPVQVENEDKIFLNLSLRQIIILMIGFGIAYSVFKSVEKNAGGGVAIFPTVIIAMISLIIALFKNSEMTFMPFMLNLIRLQLNGREHVWSKGVESFHSIEVGYVKPESKDDEKRVVKKEKEVDEDILSRI